MWTKADSLHLSIKLGLREGLQSIRGVGKPLSELRDQNTIVRRG
jgi:hypothetical protein